MAQLKTAICRDCKREIEFNGKWWEHVGMVLRHQAMPEKHSQSEKESNNDKSD